MLFHLMALTIELVDARFQKPAAACLCQSIICRIDFHWYFRLCALSTGSAEVFVAAGQCEQHGQVGLAGGGGARVPRHLCSRGERCGPAAGLHGRPLLAPHLTRLSWSGYASPLHCTKLSPHPLERCFHAWWSRSGGFMAARCSRLMSYAFVSLSVPLALSSSRH